MIQKFGRHTPQIDPSAFVDATALIIGKVTLHAGASVWPYAVLRGDIEEIVVGEGSNIQDHAVIHTNHHQPTHIGNNTTVGHSAILHGCHVGNRCLIGMGAVLLDGSKIESESIVGAGSLISQNTLIKKRSLAVGVPARVIRKLSSSEIQKISNNGKEYLQLKQMYQKEKTSRKDKPQ